MVNDITLHKFDEEVEVYTKSKGSLSSVHIKVTPMSTDCYLDNDESGQSIDMKQYQDMIGSLLYLLYQISCLVYACVLDSNPIPNNHT